MRTADGTDPPPRLSPREVEELANIAYFVGRIDELRDRGLVAEEAHATIVREAHASRAVIETNGRYLAEREQAHRLKPTDLRAAVAWAGRARRTDPSREPAWALEVEMLHSLGDHAGALAVCEEAAGRLPDFALRAEELRSESAARAADPLLTAREAVVRGDDAAVIDLCTVRLADTPDDFDATVLLAFALQRVGRLDEALALYRRLSTLQPENATWRQWSQSVEQRLQSRPGTPAPAAAVATPQPATPRLSWSSVAGEFLEDHWQKLILCLAVLLIVVSSNVGAYQLLGPRLWSPVGKCVLALVYTAMFAGLGVGLVRWGAGRAGRIMLLTTLIVVPADFMLAGQMKLLTEPSPSKLVVLGLDAVALFLLIRVVSTALRLPRGGGVFPTALFTLSAFNAASAPGLPWPWSWQFAVFLSPAFVFLGSAAWVTTRPPVDPQDDPREPTYFALGLLAFAFVTCVVRTGVFALELVPTLYAVPVMVAAVACVQNAARLPRFDPDPRRAAWLKFAGLVLSALALSLALARPPGSALYSGNTLAAAVIGLGLYATLLRRERLPAYLYFAFGSLFLAYFGTFHFVKDLMQSVERAAQQALGYDRKLPEPFKAINGLVFSPLLAALSLHFRRRWGDANLARHCHYLGVPFAVAACVFSGFEPKAAVICLTGYAALFALAVPVFAEPRVTYLAAAALTGSAYFGSTLRPGTTLAGQALAAATLGGVYWLTGAVVHGRGAAWGYRRPLDHAALGMAGLASFAAALSLALAPPDTVPLGAALAFLVVAWTAVLVNRDGPHPALGYLAVGGGSLGLVLLLIHTGLRWRVALTPAEAGAAVAAAALAGVWLGGRLRRALEDGGPPRLAVYPVPLSQAGVVEVALSLLLCGLHAGRLLDRLTSPDFTATAAALGLSAAALALLTRPYPRRALAHLSLACGLGVWFCLLRIGFDASQAGAEIYGAGASAYALVSLAAEEAARRYAARTKGADTDFRSDSWRPTLSLFEAALPGFEVGVVFAAVVLCIAGRQNGPAVVFALAAGAGAMLWSTRLRRSEQAIELAVVLGYAAALCLTSLRVGWDDSSRSVAWLAVTTAVSSLTLRAAGRWASTREGPRFTAEPLLVAATRLTWVVFALALAGSFGKEPAYRVGIAALVLNAVSLLLLAGHRRRPDLTYRAILSAVVAVYVAVLNAGTPTPDNTYVLGLVAVVLALILSAVGFACRARPLGADGAGWETVFARPPFVAALVLTALAVVPAYASPWTMGLVALSFLVLVKGLPAREWLYATVAALGCACYAAILARWPEERMVPAALAGAYLLWLVGLLVRRAEPALVRVFRLPGRRYDLPIFNSAAVACIAAVALRSYATANGTVPLSDSAPLAWGLAAFSLLMIKPHPGAGWVHLASSLALAGVVMGAYPHVRELTWWLPIGLAAANVGNLTRRAVRRHEARICGWFGVPELGYTGPLGVCARGLFAGSTALLGALVVVAAVATLTGTAEPPGAAVVAAWWGAALAVVLAGVYAATEGRDGGREDAVMALGVLFVAAVWWLAAPASPLVARFGLDPLVGLPLSTAALAAAAIAAGLAAVDRPGWRGPFWRRVGEADPRARLDAFTAQGGLALAGISVLMTRGQLNLTTPLTLLLAAVGPGLLAVGRRSVGAGYGAGLLGCGAAAFAALEATRRAGVTAEPDRLVLASVGLLAAVAVLWAAAGLIRRREQATTPGEAVALPAGTVAVALEQTALGAAVVAGAAVVLSALEGRPTAPSFAWCAVGVTSGLALFAVGLIVRWGAEWLVYLAHAALLGSYLYYRWAFPVGASGDVAVLTLLGYLDFGLAEAMHRAGLEKFSKPTRLFSLILPVLHLALWVVDGVQGPSRLFVLFTAATFYGVAGYTMRWRSLGYAAAVLYNAFLWLLWARVGWTVADHSQFYLVPVGLSAVLFAEVNRRAMGREAVTAVRAIGLVLIYASLAVPVWQFASLGAWLTLLLVSLAGVFAGIGLRVQVFLWLGLVGFVLDVVYQLGRVGMEHTLAKWGIMLALGLLLILFVALNEKKRIVPTLRGYIDEARRWE